jgi:hypothetical protein
VPTPQDPDEEPAKDGLSDEDAIWRSIVDNYGDRPQLEDEPEIEVPPSLRDLGAQPGAGPDAHPGPQPDPGPDDRGAETDFEEHYVPPPPPPLPRPAPPRLLAWIGLFGVPVFVLVALVIGVSLPSWLGLVLMFWFVGGFVYLVASMRPRPGDGYDDGARV